MQTQPPSILRAVGITKRFGNVRALNGVDFEVSPGEVVGLVGDNGAGKSTLIKILSGALQPSAGDVYFDGEPVALSSPIVARRIGIETVYQDLALALQLSVAANLFLGRELKQRGLRGLLRWRDEEEMQRRAASNLQSLGITLRSAKVRCDDLSGGQRQAVAVARAVAWGSRLLLMDEPTAALGVAEERHVADVVKEVKERGIGVVFITHNLPQVHKLCDRIVVLYRGINIAELRPDEASVEEIIRWITGAAVTDSGQRVT